MIAMMSSERTVGKHRNVELGFMSGGLEEGLFSRVGGFGMGKLSPRDLE